MAQIIAATNPCYFMGLPGARLMFLFSLFIEKIGLCHFGWVIGKGIIKICEYFKIMKPEPFSIGKAVVISGASIENSSA